MPRERILFVTGRLAEPALRRVVNRPYWASPWRL
jgi:hypothetical protein